MKKREPEVPTLLVCLAFLLLIVSGAAYYFMDYRFYGGHGDSWKEFWLPATTSMVAALVTFIVVFMFLRNNRSNDRTDLAEEVLDNVLDKLKDQLALHLTTRQEGQTEILLQLIQKLLPSGANAQDISPPETIKEAPSTNRRTKNPTGNK